MATEPGRPSMKLEIALVAAIAGVWAVLAAAYALAPWPGMTGYAWIWGAGAILFGGLAVALGRAAVAARAIPEPVNSPSAKETRP